MMDNKLRHYSMFGSYLNMASAENLKNAGDLLFPVPQKVIDILHGLCVSQSLFTACELGIFDVLQSAGEPQSAMKIAEALSTNQDATSRLLDVLVSLELLVKQTGAKDDEPVYSNSPFASCLTTGSPGGFLARVIEFERFFVPLNRNLTRVVREGRNQLPRTLNTSCDDLFQNVTENQERLMHFINRMRGYVKPAAARFVTAFDLNRFKRMCDLGGGTGEVAYIASMFYPNTKITVLDLPEVVQASTHFRPSVEECPNQQNVTFLTGDFFEPTLPAADLYVLTHILHDWKEDKIDILLSNIFERLPSGGGILIGELLLFDDKSGPLTAQLFSLYMLAICDGRERSGQEYKQLLEKHGFKDVQWKYTNTNSLDAVLAIKP